MLPQLFVSYSRKDRSFVNWLIPLLQRVYGHDHVWFDNKLYGGERWKEALFHQIRESDVFLYLLSKHSLESSHCRAEYEEAIKAHKAILPVLIRAHTDVPSPLSELHHVDMSEGTQKPESLAELYAAIRRVEEKFAHHSTNSATPASLTSPSLQPSTCQSWPCKDRRDTTISFPFHKATKRTVPLVALALMIGWKFT